MVLVSYMEDNFLNDCLIIYIEKKIASKFSSESIIDGFVSMKYHRAQLNLRKENDILRYMNLT